MVISEKYNLIKQDLQKVLVGAGVAGIGAFLAFLVENLPNVDLGEWAPFIGAFLAVIANIVRKYVLETKYQK